MAIAVHGWKGCGQQSACPKVLVLFNQKLWKQLIAAPGVVLLGRVDPEGALALS